MKATHATLVLLAAGLVAGCGRTPGPVAPPDARPQFDQVQRTTTTDTTTAVQRGVHTFGGGG